MIFPDIFTEEILQVKDKTRLRAENTFRIDAAPLITDVQIEPEAGAGFTSVYSGGDSKKWYLDWAYLTDGDKVVTVKVIDDLAAEYFEDATITVKTVTDDHLFSTDRNLIEWEHDIRRYIPKGRVSWKNKHRAAQKFIVDHLNDEGITDRQGNRLTAEAIVDIEEVREWSTFKTLHLIYEDIRITNDDSFKEKSDTYNTMAIESAERAGIRLDVTGDGIEDINKNLFTGRIVRR